MFTGLGSSGAAIVGGVLLANAVCNLGLRQDFQLADCVVVEGHPDNVSASLLGGCVACCTTDKLRGASLALPVKVDPAIRCLAVVPNFTKSTAESRKALPDSYPKSDVIFNLQRVGILVAGLASAQNKEILRHAMKDTMHQPYRARLIPGFSQILELNEDHSLHALGLIGISLSGAGPTILALIHSSDEQAKTIGERISDIFSQHQIKSTVKLLSVDHSGAQY